MCAKSSEALLWTLNLKHVTVFFWGTASINKKIIISIPKITISINLGCLMLNDIWMPQIVWNTPVTSTHKTFSWEWDWLTLFSQNTMLKKGVFGGPKWKRLEVQRMLLGGRRLTHPAFNGSPSVGVRLQNLSAGRGLRHPQGQRFSHRVPETTRVPSVPLRVKGGDGPSQFGFSSTRVAQTLF